MNSKNWEIIGSDIKALQELINKLEIQNRKESKNFNNKDTNNTIDNNVGVNWIDKWRNTKRLKIIWVEKYFLNTLRIKIYT